MEVETSIALPRDLLDAIDRRSAEFGGRSELIETAVRLFIGRPKGDDLDSRDLEIINQHAAELNEEAADALSYQVPL